MGAGERPTPTVERIVAWWSSPDRISEFCNKRIKCWKIATICNKTITTARDKNCSIMHAYWNVNPTCIQTRIWRRNSILWLTKDWKILAVRRGTKQAWPPYLIYSLMHQEKQQLHSSCRFSVQASNNSPKQNSHYTNPKISIPPCNSFNAVYNLRERLEVWPALGSFEGL